jgi:hypothetical protein
MLCERATPRTRTQRKPTAEQKVMCHIVRAMGQGKPEYARSLREGCERGRERARGRRRRRRAGGRGGRPWRRATRHLLKRMTDEEMVIHIAT